MGIKGRKLVPYLEKRKVWCVGLDTMCFIYHFEKNIEYLPVTDALFHKIEQGRWKGVTSILSLLEVLTGARKTQNQDLAGKYRFIFRAFPNLIVAPVDEEIVNRASFIRVEYSMRTPDAIQLATALVNHAEVFLTNDEALKKVEEIEVITLREFSS